MHILILFGAIAALVVGIAAYVSYLGEKSWHALAREMGLTYKVEFAGTRRFVGEIDGQAIEIRPAQGKAPALFRVGGVPTGLNVKPETRWTGVQKVFSGEDVLLGDEGFDAAVNITGDEEEIVALMTATTRSLVMRGIADGVTIENGVISLTRLDVMKDPVEMERWAKSRPDGSRWPGSRTRPEE